jgi:acyl carrier protein/SAM-dependent methyltransferase
LTRLCIDAGAKKVYGIEANDRAFEQALEYAKSIGIQDKITLIHGDANLVELPEKVDICVSELIGTIGGSEGVVTILNEARRFLKPGGQMIPQRCITKLAAVTLPDEFAADPQFTSLSGGYVQQIFEKVGHKLDLRLCLDNFPASNIISTSGTFEDLDFSAYVNPTYKRDISLTITEDGRLDGFLLWLNLYTVEGQVIDYFNDRNSWLPVYFPVFNGIETEAGDHIEAVCSSWLSEDGVNPDYRIAGRLLRRNGEQIEFEYDSLLYGRTYKGNSFYEVLFSDDEIKIRPGTRIDLSTPTLRKYLEEQLPSYMVPTQFIWLEELPLTPSGKVDCSALPEPSFERGSAGGAVIGPRNTEEETLADIWRETLGIQVFDVHTSFFDLGGHSLLATQVITRIRHEFQIEISLRELFKFPTISEMAKYIGTISFTLHDLETDRGDTKEGREVIEL